MNLQSVYGISSEFPNMFKIIGLVPDLDPALTNVADGPEYIVPDSQQCFRSAKQVVYKYLIAAACFFSKQCGTPGTVRNQIIHPASGSKSHHCLREYNQNKLKKIKKIVNEDTFFRCCGSEMIYSVSGSIFEFSEFRIQSDPDPTHIKRDWK